MDAIAGMLSDIKNKHTRKIENKTCVSDIVVEYLRAAGVDKVFGMPGGATIPFHKSVEKHEGIDFILARHEGGAAFMADCYARVSGKLGVCVATTGPGATNLMTGVGAAYMDSVPMLVITGMNPTDSWGRGDFQECTPMLGVDTTSMFKSMCKLSEVVISEKILTQRLSNAIATALSGKPGPVHLAIPRDLWGRSISNIPFDVSKCLSSPPAPTLSNIIEISGLLNSAKRPLILCGSGASTEALSLLLEISKHHSIPLVTTPRAKGKGVASLPNTFFGSMGISASPIAEELIQSTTFDVVLTVGTGFGNYATNSWDAVFLPTNTMIQVNISPESIGRIFPADIGIVSDSTVFASMLHKYMITCEHHLNYAKRTAWLSKWTDKDRWPADDDISKIIGSYMSPYKIIKAVDQVIGEDGIVLADSNSILLWATRYLPERPRRKFYGAWGWASMGHMTAGVIGAKLASPNSDVVALVGDGCMLMNGTEVATAADLGLNIIWIINVNSQLGMIHYELRSSNLTKSVSFCNYDYVGFARSLGAYAYSCSKAEELPGIIKESLKHSGPTVIQVNVIPELTPPMGMKKQGSAKWKAYIEEI